MIHHKKIKPKAAIIKSKLRLSITFLKESITDTEIFRKVNHFATIFSISFSTYTCQSNDPVTA